MTLPSLLSLRRAPILAATAAMTGALLVSSLPASASPTEKHPTEMRCAMTRTGEYPTADARGVGFDPELVRQATTYWTMNGAETVKVFRHGCLVAEGGLDPVFDRIPRLNWSQTKTVAALSAGVAEKQGLIEIDAPIGRYLPPGLGDAEHRKVTVRHVLNMTTGFQMNWVRGLNLVGDMSRVRSMMAADVKHPAGTYFEYDQDTPSIITYVVQRAIWRKVDPRLDYQDWAQRELFDKLGIPKSAYFWQRDRSGNTLGYSQLFLRPLEFGRLGELMLNGGRFQGVQLIRPAFMRQFTMGSVDRTGRSVNCGYGFMVWLNSCRPGQTQVNASLFKRRVIKPAQPWIASAPRDMYYTWGYHGQHTFVIPSLDMVVTRSGELPPDTVADLLHLDGEAAVAGSNKAAYFTFFRLLMNAVEHMPAGVRIARPTGPYKHVPELNVEPDGFLYPTDAAPGSYLGIGPSAPVGCTLLACEDEPNDGLKWIFDIPRVVPGILGLDSRPNG